MSGAAQGLERVCVVRQQKPPTLAKVLSGLV